VPAKSPQSRSVGAYNTSMTGGQSIDIASAPARCGQCRDLAF
jgi:hypothetical protein